MSRKLVSLLLIITLLSGLFSGCGKSKSKVEKEKDNGASIIPIADLAQFQIFGVKDEPADGIGVPGVDFKILETGPADDWDEVPIPIFNPLGSKSLYGSYSYEEDALTTLHILEGYTEKTTYITGETWNLSIPEDIDYSLYWVRWYASKLGALRYGGTLEHSAFSFQEDENNLWWLDVESRGSGAELTVVRINTLPSGKNLTVKQPDLEEEGYEFYTECTPGKLQSMTVTIKGSQESGVYIMAEHLEENGILEYRINNQWYGDNLNSKKTNTFILDDLPIADGMLHWVVRAENGVDIPEEVSLQINDVADIDKITWGDALGMIRLKGLPMGSATVKLSDFASVVHQEIDYTGGELHGVIDENGDTLYVGPAGYYEIMFPSGLGNNYSSIRLVPVSAGEITTVTFPEDIKVSVGAMSRIYGDFDINEGGVEILENKDNGSSATVSFVLNDPLDRDITIEKKDININEDGIKAVITGVQREIAGSDIILVLDSSGSMGSNMKPCIDAASRFVQGLPENSTIRLIQFQQTITEHKGEGKAAVLKALSTIKEGGGTSLYDATIRGIELLKDKKRGYVVVFSDGADSREPGVDGKGSNATKSQLLSIIQESNINVLTIGFGKGHDPTTLQQMANASPYGAYFAATDKSALDGVFASVAGKLGNQFLVTYQRPVVAMDENSTVPVVSLMIDRSGSMDLPPELYDDVDYRIDKIKNIFHDFILGLPTGTLMQVGSFAEPLGGREPTYDQITTTKKAPALQALGSLRAGGGTPTVDALRLAYHNLNPIPSNKKVLVFFTDAAIKGEDDNEGDSLEEILIDFKNAGIRVLLAGLVNKENSINYEKDFKNAAEKAGGDYIITDSIGAIEMKLKELLKRTNEPIRSDGLMFSLGINTDMDDGSIINFYSGKKLDKFKQLRKSGQVLSPETYAIKTGEKYITYEPSAAKLLYGGDQPAVDTRIVGRLDFNNKSATNEVAKLSVSEAYWLDTFKGIEAPSGKAYLAINTSLELTKSTPYNIPNIFRHFYLSCNDGVLTPASQATWLAETPFLPPGEEGLIVGKGEKVSGMMVFIVERGLYEEIKQLSLHLFDTMNGHINLPLTGRSVYQMKAIDKLPENEPNNIKDTFALKITGRADEIQLAGLELYQRLSSDYDKESKRNASFRVLEGSFSTKVQALLDIDPKKRFLYEIQTDQGVLLSPMSNIVHNIPLGFTGSTMLAPGSESIVRMPFIVPNELLNTKAGIFGDLENSSLYIPIVKGEPYVTSSIGSTFKHEYFDLTINSLSLLEKEGDSIVLDFTMSDKIDGSGTGGLEGVLLLQKKEEVSNSDKDENNGLTDSELIQSVAGRKGIANFGSDESTNEDYITIDEMKTDELLYGGYKEDANWGAFDGQKRRGIFVFTLPEGSDPNEWILSSSIFPQLSLSISNSVYPHTPLLATVPTIDIDTTFQDKLELAISSAINEYESTRLDHKDVKRIGLSDDEIMGIQVPSPSLTVYGTNLISKVQNYDDFLAVMNSQRWVPGNDSFYYYYSPESVLTQGFGSQNDLYNLAKVLLTKIGYQPKHRAVSLSEIGMENLRRNGKVEDVLDWLPALSYFDEKGEPKLYVPVFSRNITELGGLCSLKNEMTNTDIRPAIGTITIELTGKLIGNAGFAASLGKIDDMSSILGGEESGNDGYYETITAFEQEVLIPDVGIDAMDISYISTGKSENGELILPVLDTRQGLLYDKTAWIDTSSYELETIKIKLKTQYDVEVTHTTILQKDQKITEVFHTLAWGVPELNENSAASFEKKATIEASASKDPTNYSIARWLGHGAIARLIKGMSDYGKDLEKKLDITAGRTAKAIAIIVTMKSDGKVAETTVDLMDHSNQLHGEDEDVKHAYNMFYGMFASEFEASSLIGDKGISYMDVWRNLPSDAGFVVLAPDDSGRYIEAADLLREKGYPQMLIERLLTLAETDANPTVYILPDKPAIVNGKSRWAWLEIDQTTYDMISVFETGERAGSADYLIGLIPKNLAEIGAGALVGVATAVGAVSAYTLVTDDYAEVMKRAKALCAYIGVNMEAFTGSAGFIENVGSVKSMITEGYGAQDGRLFEVLAKMTEMAESKWIQPSFGNGYGEAVKVYFEKAK